jgi:hypothetical protein
MGLFSVGGVHIDVQTQLGALGLVTAVEHDRGLRAAETDARRIYFYVFSVAGTRVWRATDAGRVSTFPFRRLARV